MLQEIFGGALIGLPGLGFGELDAGQKTQIAAVAASFVGLLSLFNILGRFFWASISDKIGRKVTYATFFVLGCLLYAGAPWAASIGSKALFVTFFCVILSMYGGGFATIPAYIADIFGTQFVGAIHGRLLTAWSTAGVVGPFVVTAIRQAQVDAGLEGAALYTRTMYILAGFLAAGFVANLLVRPLAAPLVHERRRTRCRSEGRCRRSEGRGSPPCRRGVGDFGIGPRRRHAARGSRLGRRRPAHCLGNMEHAVEGDDSLGVGTESATPFRGQRRFVSVRDPRPVAHGGRRDRPLRDIDATGTTSSVTACKQTDSSRPAGSFRAEPLRWPSTTRRVGLSLPAHPTFTRQMSSAYSRMERSEENQAIRAVLRMAFFHQLALSIQAASISRWTRQ